MNINFDELEDLIFEGEFLGKKFKINLISLIEILSGSKEEKIDMGFIKIRIYKVKK